jgi:ureidoglycolate hydrolase
VLKPKELIYPETEEGRVAMEILQFKYRPGGRRMDQLAIHFSYNQTFIPVQGSMVLVVAPPPGNREAGPDAYEIAYDKVAAFMVEPGQAAFIFKGTWHNAITLGNDCSFINVTRKNTGEGTSPTSELGGKIEKINTVRPYVEYIDLKKRDNRIIELEV